MKCVYINLDAATGRRALIERSFAEVPNGGWRLERFPAVTGATASALPGTLGSAHKGCFQSHREVIERHLGDDAPLIVLEDDAALSVSTFSVIGDLLRRPHDWDVLFTDVAIGDIGMMVKLATRRDEMIREGRFVALNLKGATFSGSTAYVVRGASKRKLHAALMGAKTLDQPYDLYLRALCQAGNLNVGVCFPFVTTIASTADTSQIAPDVLPLELVALSAFRRLMFVDRDLEACRREDEALRARADDATMMVGTVLGALARPYDTTPSA